MDDIQIQLWEAAKDGDLRHAEELLTDWGADPNFDYKDRIAPLIVASSLGLANMVKLLVEYEADVNIINLANDYQLAPLIQSGVNGHTQTVKILLEHGADPEVSNQLGQTALHDAALFGFLDIGRLLIEYGANVNVQDYIKNTPLHHAAQNNHVPFIDLLINNGADRSLKNEGGVTSLLLARTQEKREAMIRLLDYCHPTLKAELSWEKYTGSVVVSDLCRSIAAYRREAIRDASEAVVDKFRSYINQYPNFWMGYYGLGEALSIIATYKREYDDALETEIIKALEKACELAPRLREPCLKLASVYSKIDLESATAAYKNAMEECDNTPCLLYPEEWQASSHFNIGVAAAIHSKGDISLSFEAFCQAIQIDPDYYGRDTMPEADLARGIWQEALFVHTELEDIHLQFKSNQPQPNDPEPKTMNEKYYAKHKELQKLHKKSIDLYQKYDQNTLDPEYLHQAIELAEKANSYAPADYPHLKEIVHHLSVLYIARFKLSRQEEDLLKALKFSDLLIKEYSSTEDESYFGRLQLKGAILFEAGVYFASRDYLEESINTLEEAVAEMSGKRQSPKVHGSLGLSYLELYKFTSSLSNLRTGIRAFERCLSHTLPNSMDRSAAFNNLGLGYRNLYERDENEDYLNKSLDAYRKALDSIGPESRYYPMRLVNLANGLVMRSKEEDLDEAIELYELAIEETEQDHPFYFRRRASLSTALRLRYSEKKDQGDIDRAIQIGERLLDLAEPDQPYYSEFLLSHAASLSLLEGKDLSKEKAQKISGHMEKAVTLGADSQLTSSVKVAISWLDWEFFVRDWERVIKAYEYAQALIRKVLNAQLLRGDKENWLKDFQGLALKAAYALSKKNDQKNLEKAVEYLDEGLGRLIRESLSLETAALESLKDLGQEKLLRRFKETSEKILYFQAKEENLPDWNKEIKSLFSDLDTINEEIRNTPGFEHFMQPLSIREIYKIALPNPLAYLFVTEAGGLILSVDGKRQKITPIWLDKFTGGELSKLLWDYSEYVLFAQHHSKEYLDSKGIGIGNIRGEDVLLKTLSSLWDFGMHDLIDFFSDEESVTLIPAGLLSFLPLHAASSNPSGNYFALDSINFNFAPNAMALKKGLDYRTVDTKEDIFVVVTDESQGPNLSPLTHSKLEAYAISCFFDKSKVLRNDQAILEAVKSEVNNNFPVCHFSCHGKARIDQPLNSFLALAKGDSLTLKEMLNQNISSRLIALSACQTSVIGAKISEESISLSSCFIQAGVRGVIGSLWSVYDRSTMLTMVKFYDLWKRGKADPVIAFNNAVRWLRDSSSEDISEYLLEIGQLIKNIHPEWYNPDQIQENLQYFKNRPGMLLFKDPVHWAGFIFSGK